MSHPFNWSLFESVPVVGIMRNFPDAQLQPVVAAYQAAGLSTLEITMNTPGATGIISRLREQWGDKMNIGAGTVLSDEDLEKALAAGAQFIVTPIVVKSVDRACKKLGIPVFPGAMTPTEIYKAWGYGATAVKVFPASRLSPGYLKDVLEPLNEVKLIPTGGVNPENFLEYMKMGAVGAGMASALWPKDIINSGNWDELRAFYDGIVNRYREFKNGQQQ